VKNHTAADTEQIDSLFAIVLPIIERLNGKWIAKCRNCIFEANAVIAKVSRRLLAILFKPPSIIVYGLLAVVCQRRGI
jgi:hypothetical protein